MTRRYNLLLFQFLSVICFSVCISCNSSHRGQGKEVSLSDKPPEATGTDLKQDNPSVNAMIVLPGIPQPGVAFRIMSAGEKNILKAQVVIITSSGEEKTTGFISGKEYPYWQIDSFNGLPAGNYRAVLTEAKKEICSCDFKVAEKTGITAGNSVWKTLRGWDSSMELIYSAWINSLFHDCDEQSSWAALHEVTQDRERNFLYNYLSLNEDDPESKKTVTMQPDCADNPFFLRAYFSWKLGLPFGYHICDRGYLGHNPGTGQWITNSTPVSKTDPVEKFNVFLRKLKDGIHSGTARTSLDNENSDYYPVSLERNSLRPGTVYADPYGHTLILVSWISQTKSHPGLLLAVDAQPDGTVGIKRFWKGNFLFSTTEVIGEPGFKAFRPIMLNKEVPYLAKNQALTASSGFMPYSLQQRKMEADDFYSIMERLINPEPLDPETALTELLKSLHEQLIVRVTSVNNGEAYFKAHPGAVIPMPSGTSAVFQSGGQWEDFSTPNRDLRLLIAMDEVLGFPDKVAGSPAAYNINGNEPAEAVRNRYQTMLEKKASQLSVSYTRSDGSVQNLTVSEILRRVEAFETAYNPNDGPEIRWGAPEGSDEISTCRRHSPPGQVQKMKALQPWFHKRLHPPT